jgi:hypothetical protein
VEHVTSSIVEEALESEVDDQLGAAITRTKRRRGIARVIDAGGSIPRKAGLAFRCPGVWEERAVSVADSSGACRGAQRGARAGCDRDVGSGLSVRDIEPTFTESREEYLPSKSAVSQLSEQLWRIRHHLQMYSLA